MATPFFVTTTERPAAKNVTSKTEEFSVSKLNKLSPKTKLKMEQASGITITNDKQLAKASDILIKKPITKPSVTNAVDTYKQVVSKDPSTLLMEQLTEEESYLTKQLAMTEEEKNACEEMYPGFINSCGWFDSGKSWVEARLASLKYSGKSLQWWTSLKASMLASVGFIGDKYEDIENAFGLMVRCGAWVASQGIKGVNSTLNELGGLKGSIETFSHITSSISDFYTIFDVNGDKIEPSIKARIPDNRKHFITLLNNTDRARLTPENLSNILASAQLQNKQLATPHEDYLDDQIVLSTENSLLLADGSTTDGKLDNMRLNATSDLLDDVNKESLGMSIKAGHKVNNGEIPEAILTKQQLKIYYELPIDERTINNAINKEAIMISTGVPNKYNISANMQATLNGGSLDDNMNLGNVRTSNVSQLILKHSVNKCNRLKSVKKEYARAYTKFMGAYA